MGVTGLWTLMKVFSPEAILECAHAGAALSLSSSVTPSRTPRVHVLLDVNALLHRATFAAAKAGGDDSAAAFVATVLRRLDHVLFSRQKHGARRAAIRSVFIASDGPPPLSKLVLQRVRRLATAKKRRTSTAALRFNALHFTPGAPFMAQLDRSLAFYAATLLQRNPDISECTVSGSRTPGEGEIKIVDRLADLVATHQTDACMYTC
ncbi:hypothetical protein HDU98_004491 [Podochytrium sp. JEL0797]|nr:hypothetical protein HDU98_004491 [Podochytrium sp. JEL0797]